MLEKLNQILSWFRGAGDERLREENEELKAALAAIEAVVDEIYEYIK